MKPHSIVRIGEKVEQEVAEQIALLSYLLKTRHGRKKEITKELSVEYKEVFPVEKSIVNSLNQISKMDIANASVAMSFGYLQDGKKISVFSNSDTLKFDPQKMFGFRARGLGSGLKGITVELQGTNPANRDFSTITINMGFSSFEELYETKAIELLENQKDAFLEISHQFQGRDKFNRASGLSLKLKYVIHNLSYNADGSLSLEVKYATYMDFYNDADNLVYKPENKAGLAKVYEKLIREEKEEKIKELKKEISNEYLKQYRGLIPKIKFKEAVFEFEENLIVEKEQQDQKEKIRIYRGVETTSPDRAIVEYCELGQVITELNSFFADLFPKQKDQGKIHLGKISLNDLEVKRIQNKVLSFDYSFDDQRSLFRFLHSSPLNAAEAEKIEEEGGYIDSSTHEISIEKFPISRAFLESFLSELDFSDITNKKGISLRNYIDKIIFSLLYKIVSLHNQNIQKLERFSLNEVSPIYGNLRIDPFFTLMEGKDFKEKRKKYLWDKKPKNKVVQRYYIHQTPETSKTSKRPVIELKFGPEYNVIKKIDFNPLDTKLFDVALVNAYQGRILNNYGITDVIRTIYKLDIKMIGAAFLTPGSIIKLSKNSFPTLSSRVPKKHKSDFVNMLTQEYLVTKVTHTLNSKNNYETQITAHPYKMIR